MRYQDAFEKSFISELQSYQRIIQYLSEQIEKQTAIRDYLNGEKALQGFLLAYLNVVDYYITQSESELNKGYSDIYMEPFISKYPDMQYSYLIELKYMQRSEYTENIQQEMIQDAKKQLDQYVKSDRLKNSMVPHKAGNPVNEDEFWTNLSRPAIASKLHKNFDIRIGDHVVKRLLKGHKFGKRKDYKNMIRKRGAFPKSRTLYPKCLNAWS
jgi:CxxC motif-containing protein